MTEAIKTKKPFVFRFLAFMTYTPLPLLGLMVIFGLMGKMLEVGWLESAPDVLMIPMLLAYYLSLIIGVIYAYLEREKPVYLPAFFGVITWLVGLILARMLDLPDAAMKVINIVILLIVLGLHIMQFSATKKWDQRITPS